MNIETLISQAAGEAVKALYGMEANEKMLQLQKTRSEFEGNLTLVVFPFVKAAKKSPEQTAQEIGQYLVDNCSAVEKFNVVKGFLNLSIGEGAWLQLLQAMDTQHQQAPAPWSCTQQPAGLVAGSDYGGQRQQGGKDQHRKRPRYSYL